MNTTFQDIYDFFLSKIISYEFLNLTEGELNIELAQNLRSSFSKCVAFKDIKADWVLEAFSRELSDLEIDIISDWMVINWLTSKINNIELLKQRLSSKDYQTYSQANHLKELMDLKKSSESNVHYWMNRYSWISKIKGGV